MSDTINNNVLETISSVTEFNDIHEFMQDDDLDRAMARIIRIIAQPEIPVDKAAVGIVQLQAMSAKFKLLAKHYTVMEKGPDASKKKNIYYTAAESLDRIVDSLKYLVRQG